MRKRGELLKTENQEVCGKRSTQVQKKRGDWEAIDVHTIQQVPRRQHYFSCTVQGWSPTNSMDLQMAPHSIFPLRVVGLLLLTAVGWWQAWQAPLRHLAGKRNVGKLELLGDKAGSRLGVCKLTPLGGTLRGYLSSEMK